MVTGWQAKLPTDAAMDVSNGMPTWAQALCKREGYHDGQARCRPSPHGANILDCRGEWI